MNHIIFSVIIPTYNRGNIIARTIESVLNQDVDVPFEIIVVDDGSTDGTKDAVTAIDSDKVIYVYQNNAGANAARNKGVETARGEFVAFLDSDDLFLKNHLSQSFEKLQFGKLRNTVVYGRILVDRGEGKKFEKPPRPLKPNEDMSDYLLRDRGFLQTSTLVLSRSLARKVKFNVSLPFGQDTDFAIRLYANGVSFEFVETPTVIWKDLFDPKRVSSKSKAIIREKWLSEIRHLITEKAYYGDKGWFVAKSYAREGAFIKAFRLYVQALFYRCYKFRHALVVAAQIFVPPAVFRKLADFYISKKG